MGPTARLDTFLNLHRAQLTSSGVPEHYWPSLFDKIQNETFDAGDTFQLLRIDYERARQPHEFPWGLQTTVDVGKSDPKHIYLIDHAWTFRVGHAKNQLIEVDTLRARMCNILGLDGTTLNTEQTADEIFNNVWRVCNSYSIGNAENVEDRLPVWYVMDEIGCAVMHSDSPNCRIVPFVYVDDQITYSLLFPIEDLEASDFIFRDFIEGVGDSNQRQALAIPWAPVLLTNYDIQGEIPGPDYYLSGHVKESLPNLLTRVSSNNSAQTNKLKVYTEYNLISHYLTDDKFEIVTSEDQADILWYTKHFKDFENLSESPGKFVNQFPFEYVLTVKDLLSATCRRFSNDQSAPWLPITFNLKTEICNFVSYFQTRQSDSLDNYWIIKPYNLARSLDTHITDNLNYILRLPATGPKIAQKYITNPVLFQRPECGPVKFDIRYVILLKSVKPLKAYVYKNFFLRFANKPFDLSDFHVYEKHFTVMNYEENAMLKHMLCSEFKEKFHAQYPSNDWSGVEKSILRMLRDILQCSIKAEPPCGIAESPQSRALYAADLMLEWTDSKEIQPKILEINWTPDCKRACEYYPDFYNEIFKLLFYDDEDPDAFVPL